VLTAIMRQPWSVVGALVTSSVRAGGPVRAGVLAAVPSLPGAIRRRRVISPALQERRRRLAGPAPAVPA
jgi:hypothetical protein